MLLVKCSCGCMFTVKYPREDRKDILLRCSNCDKSCEIGRWTELSQIPDRLAKSEMCVQVIPDDAKINVTFSV